MELSALVGTPAAPNMPAEEGEGMAGVTGEEPFDTLDTFLRELQADLAEASQPTSTTTSATPSCRRQRYNIAAANPLLAGESREQIRFETVETRGCRVDHRFTLQQRN